MNNGAADANQAYGALNESLHLARFSLERAFRTHLEPLISGDARPWPNIALLDHVARRHGLLAAQPIPRNEL
jgi:hypothetical protein